MLEARGLIRLRSQLPSDQLRNNKCDQRDGENHNANGCAAVRLGSVPVIYFFPLGSQSFRFDVHVVFLSSFRSSTIRDHSQNSGARSAERWRIEHTTATPGYDPDIGALTLRHCIRTSRARPHPEV